MYQDVAVMVTKDQVLGFKKANALVAVVQMVAMEATEASRMIRMTTILKDALHPSQKPTVLAKVHTLKAVEVHQELQRPTKEEMAEELSV